MSDDFEARVRRALAEEAGAVVPAADGLRRIRERTAARRTRWSRWGAPALALAGAAAVILAVTALPRLIPDDRGPGLPAAGATSTPAPTTAPPSAPASGPTAAAVDLTAPPTSLLPTPPSPYPAPSAVPIPGAQVADMATVWPYPSRGVAYARAEQDVDQGVVPDLTRPDVAATAFVGSYVGTPGDLTAVPAGAWQAGLRMEVRRRGAPVSLVYLVRVRVGDDAPYVVVDAVAPGSLTLAQPTRPGLLAGEVTATGTKHSAGRLTVDLRAPGADRATAATSGTVDPGTWSARLGRQPGNRVDVVAAWTTSPTGDVTAFAAVPVVATG